MPVSARTLKIPGAHDKRRVKSLLFLMVHCLLMGCNSSVEQHDSVQSPGVKSDRAEPIVNNDEVVPVIKYDERGRIKGLFGLRTHPLNDPTCRPEEYTVDFVNIERNEYLVFQLPSTFRVWVKVRGEMHQIFSDPKNIKAHEFLARGKKYKLKVYTCDATGHSAHGPISVELLN